MGVNEFRVRFRGMYYGRLGCGVTLRDSLLKFPIFVDFLNIKNIGFFMNFRCSLMVIVKIDSFDRINLKTFIHRTKYKTFYF